MVIDLNNLLTLADKVSEFGNVLIQKFNTYRDQIRNAWNDALHFNDNDCIDLYDFARLIKEYILDSSIQSRTQDAMDYFSSVIVTIAINADKY